MPHGYSETLANLRADVRKRSDTENKTARHPDTDVTREVNKAVRAWHELRNNANQHSGEVLSSVGTTTANIPGLNIGNTTLRVDALYMSDGGAFAAQDFWQLTPITRQEIAEYYLAQQRGRPERFSLEYDYNPFVPTENVANFFPIPDKTYTVYVVQLSTALALSADGDAVLVPMADGIEWIVVEAARKLIIKDNDDARYQMLSAELAMLTPRVLEAARQQQNAAPIMRRDTRTLRKLSEGRARNWWWLP